MGISNRRSQQYQSRKKSKPPRNAIILRDLRFVISIRDVHGIIMESQGVPAFYSREEKFGAILPFQPDKEMYNTEVIATVHNITNEIVLEPKKDDRYVNEINEDLGEIDITNHAIITNLFEEQKIRMVSQLFSAVGMTLVSLILFIIANVVHADIFPFRIIPACLFLFCISWCIRWFRILNKSIVYDSVGNWINLATGNTSLNDGTFHYNVEDLKKQKVQKSKGC